jgi:hypothetical protein
MKRNTGKAIIKEMLPHMPGFVTDNKKMILISPIGYTLRAFLLDSSSDKNAFYFQWFFMPICRPINYLTLTYGDRLPAPIPTGWNLDIPELPVQLAKVANRSAARFLLGLDSIAKTVSAIRARKKFLDIHDLENIAYLLILDGDFSAAAKTLAELARHASTYQWERDVVARGLSVLEMLRQDPTVAVSQIKAWWVKTITDLKLEAWK